MGLGAWGGGIVEVWTGHRVEASSQPYCLAVYCALICVVAYSLALYSLSVSGAVYVSTCVLLCSLWPTGVIRVHSKTGPCKGRSHVCSLWLVYCMW